MRKLRNFIIVIIIITATYWLLQKVKILPSVKDIFAPKAVVIDETPVLVKDIKSIGQLITYSFFDEVVADSAILSRGASFVNAFNMLAPVALLPSAEKQLVLIGRGKVLAGIDLSMLTDTSIMVKNDTITLFLPKPAILAAILNPANFEIFIEKGNWSNEEVTQVKLKARRKMEERALQQNILEKAGKKAAAVMRDLMYNMGYKKVIIL